MFHWRSVLFGVSGAKYFLIPVFEKMRRKEIISELQNNPKFWKNND
jgi:hypothetical protein